MKRIASSIRTLRDHHGLSSTQLAHRLGVSQSTAVRLEQAEKRGAITVGSLRRVAEALGYTFTYRFESKKGKSLSGGRSRKLGMTRVRRLSRAVLMRRESVNDKSRKKELGAALRLSPSERLLQACSLSDLSMLLGKR